MRHDVVAMQLATDYDFQATAVKFSQIFALCGTSDLIELAGTTMSTIAVCFLVRLNSVCNMVDVATTGDTSTQLDRYTDVKKQIDTTIGQLNSCLADIEQHSGSDSALVRSFSIP